MAQQYRAKFAFEGQEGEGQEGEMSLRKDDDDELIDNGWWLVKKDDAGDWAPNNYVELVPLAGIHVGVYLENLQTWMTVSSGRHCPT